MKVYRIKTKAGISHAVLGSDDVFELVETDFETVKHQAIYVPAHDAEILAPCTPSKVVAVGLNYRQHAAELNMALPAEPLIFIKPATTVIAVDEAIVYPKQSMRVDYEAELAVVIKKTCKHVTADEAADYIAGYTCLNDVTARDLQKRDGQWTRAKGFDTFCPIGPFIETDFDWRGKQITGKLNGKVVQQSSTDDLIFGVEDIIAHISGVMTLNAGDVIATGTPSGIGPMLPGDVVSVEIEGLGALKNTVVQQ